MNGKPAEQCFEEGCTAPRVRSTRWCPNHQRPLVTAANDRQVGGTHYATPIQHWDFVAANGLDYFQGQVTKYVVRFRHKNGLEDLKKARHFLDKLIELEEQAEAERQGRKAGVVPFAGPHPDGAVARAARIHATEDLL